LGPPAAGLYWRDGTLPYDTRFSYSYDVIVHPEGAFAGTRFDSFAYVTAQDSTSSEQQALRRRVVIAYFGDNQGP